MYSHQSSVHVEYSYLFLQKEHENVSWLMQYQLDFSMGVQRHPRRREMRHGNVR